MDKFKADSEYRFLTWGDFYRYWCKMDWRIQEGIILFAIILSFICFILGFLLGRGK